MERGHIFTLVPRTQYGNDTQIDVSICRDNEGKMFMELIVDGKPTDIIYQLKQNERPTTILAGEVFSDSIRKYLRKK